jgi:aryl-alcohol dehydrogenase-like predicted oxidoreductase
MQIQKRKGKIRHIGITENPIVDFTNEMLKRAVHDPVWEVYMVGFHMMHQGFLVHEGDAGTMIEAAYRFARHEPGVDVVLFGTGDAAHLRSNVGSLLKPPLPEADRQKLAALFGHLTGIGLDSHQGPGATR